MSVLITMTIAGAAVAAGPARAGQRDALCVGDGRGCYASVQAAVDAAADGATIRVGRGTFKGPITIEKSLALVGSGPRWTTIQGGGPVLTIGTIFGPTAPTVTIAGVTITGGHTRSSALTERELGDAGVAALGGGISIPPSAGYGDGAAVTIRDSVIARNTVAPRSSVPSGLECGSACPFALAAGAGIESWGPLTVLDSRITDNVSGGTRTSDAIAAGIFSQQGGLTLKRSVVARNRSVAVPPYGRYAEAAGIFVRSRGFWAPGDGRSATLLVEDSAVLANEAALSAAFASDVEAVANAGGLLIGGDDDCTQPTSGCVVATVRDTRVEGNSVSATNSIGDAVAFSGGIGNGGSLTLGHSSVDDNHVAASVPDGSSANAFADSGGLGMGSAATIADTRVSGNTVKANAPAGFALANAGGLNVGHPTVTTTIDDTLVAGNRVTARTTHGSVYSSGAGINNLGLLRLRRTRVDANAVTASGGAGAARGGGIINTKFPDGPDAASLALIESTVTRNTVTAAAGIEVAGGGVFNEQRLTLTNSLVARNAPDQCYGC